MSKAKSKLNKVYQLVENMNGNGSAKLRQELKNIIIYFKQNENNFHNLQDNVPIGLYRTTPQGEFTFVNKWFAKILGYKSTNELLNKQVADIYADPLKRKEIVTLLNQHGRINETEVLLKRKDGSRVWVMISAKTEYDNNKKAHNYDGYIYDISERKKMIEKLRESEEMFRGISHNLKSALYIFNENGEFIYLNPASYKITGYPKKDLLGMKFWDVIHPDFRELIKERGFQRISGSDVPNDYKLKILTKNGFEKWLEISAVKLEIQGKSVVMGLGNDITKQIETLELSRKNEEKYKSLYSFFRLMADNVPDMIWSKDLDGNFIFVNREICDKLLMAKNTNEPIGKSETYFRERERKKNPQNKEWYTFGDNNIDSDKVIIETKRPQRFKEFGNVKGEFLQLDVYKAPLWDDHGKMIGIVGSARDVTHEMQILKEKEQIETLKNVVYNISNAVNTTRDLNELFTVIRLELNQVIDTSNLFIALYDKEKSEITLPYFVDQKDRFIKFPAKKTLTHYLIKQNKPLLLKQEDYYQLLEQDEIEIIGTPAKVWLGVPLKINGETIGAIVIQNYQKEDAFSERDLELLGFISNQISISISQKQIDDALRESEYRLRQIIDTVPHMIYVKDKNDRFILANKATADAYGMRVDEIEGSEHLKIHKDINERKLFSRDDNLVLSTGKTNIRDGEKFTDHKGNIRYLQTIKIPLRAEVGNGDALLGVGIDITNHRNTEIELKLAKDKAEESDRLKSAFLANMSHEIRTPMNAIIGFSELLNDQDITRDERKEFVRLITENSKVLLNLIEAVIDVAKIEAEQIKIVHSTCLINQIMDDLAEHYAMEIRKSAHKKIEIKTIKAEKNQGFTIVTDPFRLKQIISNLLANAVKFTDYGLIELGYQFINNHILQFYVKDSGIGLPPDKLKLIFERFRQAEESSTKEYGGTGLGLTISRKLVELLGGEIWVESEVKKGSTFYFTIPLKLPKDGTKTKPFSDLSDKHDWSGKVILVAEDEKSNFELVKALLSRTNATIKWVKNGKEAVEFCTSNNRIDLVLMDIRMPVMNGYEAAKKIKSMKPDLPVISLTAYATAEDRDKSLLSGCDDHINKPIRSAELMEKLSWQLK